RTLLSVSICRPRVAHHMKDMGVRQVVEYFICIHAYDRAVSYIKLFLSAPLKVFPGLKGRLEKSSHIICARSSSFLNNFLIDFTSLVIIHVKVHVPEFADMGSSGTNLSFFVNNCFIVLIRSRG